MFYYYNLSIRPFLLNKIFWNNLNLIPSFSKIDLYTFNKKIKSTQDSDVFKSIAFIETLTQQISGNFFFSFIDKRHKISCNRVIVTLRNKILDDFLVYFFCFLINILKRTNDLKSITLNTFCVYRFFITDFSVFSFLPIPYYYWKKTFLVEFTFSTNSLFHVKLLLSCFNFPIF